MQADPTEQQLLLDLAAEDVALTQLAHRRRTLPEEAVVQTATEAERGFAVDEVRAETEVGDLVREQDRLEADVETVRQREDRDQKLIDSGRVGAKEITGLQHELETLRRRRSDLEDQVLDLMERREAAETGLGTAREGRRSAAADLERARRLRDDALADLADQTGRHEATRAEIAARVPSPLLSLYDRVRTQTGSTGAALLKARQCQGCRLELDGREVARVRGADPVEVVRCDNCGRILVRTAESGL